MSALPPSDSDAMNAALPVAGAQVEEIARRWATVHRDAAYLANIADLAAKEDHAQQDTLLSALVDAGDWQRRLALDAINDIEAMMQPGLTALRTISARGQDATAPALALWREFHAAREAVLAMLSVETPAAA